MDYNAKTLQKIDALAELTNGGWSLVRGDDLAGLKEIDCNYQPKKVYYPGSSGDIAPLLCLSAEEYHYQDLERIVDRLQVSLDQLAKQGEIEAADSYRKETTVDGLFGEEDKLVGRSVITVDGQEKELFVWEQSNVMEELPEEIKDVDLVYGLNSLVTEVMLDEICPGCLILDHPGLGLDDYRLTEEEIKKYNLELRPESDAGHSVSDYDNVYRKSPTSLLANASQMVRRALNPQKKDHKLLEQGDLDSIAEEELELIFRQFCRDFLGNKVRRQDRKQLERETSAYPIEELIPDDILREFGFD